MNLLQEILKAKQSLTTVSLILEEIVAVFARAVEMGCTIIAKGTRWLSAIIRGSESQESFLQKRRVFLVIIGVHLTVRRADVDLVTVRLQD